MEQRKSRRVVFERGYNAQMMAIDGTWRRACKVEDISDTGAKLSVESSIDGLPLKEFFLVLSSTGLAFRRCQLAWVNGDNLGVFFLRSGEKKSQKPTVIAFSGASVSPALGIEHPVHVTVQRFQEPNPRHHRWAAARYQHQDLDRRLPFRQVGFRFRQAGDVVSSVTKRDELSSARQGYRILEFALPAIVSHSLPASFAFRLQLGSGLDRLRNLQKRHCQMKMRLANRF
jgi:hypothetical protein